MEGDGPKRRRSCPCEEVSWGHKVRAVVSNIFMHVFLTVCISEKNSILWLIKDFYILPSGLIIVFIVGVI